MENKKNKIISKIQIEQILNTFIDSSEKITINNTYLYQRAFASQCFYEQLLTEPENESLYKDETCMFYKSNETSECVGDSVVNLICVEYIQQRFEDEREGFISLLKMHISQTQGLCMFAKYLNLDEYILLSSETEKSIIKSKIEEQAILG